VPDHGLPVELEVIHVDYYDACDTDCPYADPYLLTTGPPTGEKNGESDVSINTRCHVGTP
jgi:hypothetical protein